MRSNIKFLLLTILLAILLGACSGDKGQTEKTSLPGPDPLVVNRDTSVKPGDDFFNYANGAWFKAHPIPGTERSNGLWRMIQDTINAQVKNICERSSTDQSAQKGSNKQKIGDFFASGMDTLNIDKAGVEPLKEEFSKIDALKDIPSLLEEIAHLQKIGAGPAFSFWVSQDDKISNKNALFFWQGGLGLSERDYYFLQDSRTKEIREKYKAHVENMLRLSGTDTKAASVQAADIMKLETELAKSSRVMEDLRDPMHNYNKMSLVKLNALTADINWKTMLTNLGVPTADTAIVGQPEFFQNLNTALKKFSLDTWKNYLRWNLVDAYAPYLSSEIEKEHFNFFSTVMNGVTIQKPRWKRVVEQTNNSLGELIGQVYVNEYLPKGTKEKLLEIGNSIRDVFAEHIQKLGWMGEETKEKALKKLSTVVMKVGYPDKWKDLTSLNVVRNSWCTNVMAANQWEYNYMITKFGKPVDRNEWNMYPQTYNAYYNPSNNEIVVPACNIIVPGFEHQMPDDAILYSIIGGSTFGHEITHGFDDQGSLYDEKGNLGDWWTPADRKKFVQKTKLLEDQFSLYKVDSLNINGKATLGENIADLGGVVMGYEAFKKTSMYKNNEMLGGFSPDKRYFLGYAYAWMVNMQPASIQHQIMTDVHSPPQYRVVGPLSNIPEFYQAFGIKEGDSMWRSDSLRVVIW